MSSNEQTYVLLDDGWIRAVVADMSIASLRSSLMAFRYVQLLNNNLSMHLRDARDNLRMQC
jgi:hypothetical protein